MRRSSKRRKSRPAARRARLASPLSRTPPRKPRSEAKAATGSPRPRRNRRSLRRAARRCAPRRGVRPISTSRGTRRANCASTWRKAGFTGSKRWAALQTAIKIGAAVSTNLGAGEDNGPGHNGLVTTYLRAGAYRAAVTAKEFVGPARLLGDARGADRDAKNRRRRRRAGDARARQGGEHPAGNHARRALPASIFWASAAAGGRGWRIPRAGRSASPARPRLLTRQFEKGRYRLVVSPEDVEARMAARLRRVHAGAGTRRPRPASPAVRGDAKAAMARAAGARRARASPMCGASRCKAKRMSSCRSPTA